MRELIADMFVSLDGHAYGEGAPAYFGYLGPDLERMLEDNVAEPQVLLMGRKTYEMMWAIVRDQPVEGRDRIDELPKVVFSRTLVGPLGWNNSRLAKEDLVDGTPGESRAGSGSTSLSSSNFASTSICCLLRNALPPGLDDATL